MDSFEQTLQWANNPRVPLNSNNTICISVSTLLWIIGLSILGFLGLIFLLNYINTSSSEDNTIVGSEEGEEDSKGNEESIQNM